MICYLPRANMMKPFSGIIAFIAILICLSVANAGIVSVKVRMTTGPQDLPTTTFASTTPKLYGIFKTEGAKTGAPNGRGEMDFARFPMVTGVWESNRKP